MGRPIFGAVLSHSNLMGKKAISGGKAANDRRGGVGIGTYLVDISTTADVAFDGWSREGRGGWEGGGRRRHVLDVDSSPFLIPQDLSRMGPEWINQSKWGAK
ncbi:hypothetical protein niasHT_032943 [Heterodera trifolii]|uniref:Uncharacterized protein n=1 Tax=Heterodera trifolii TaxID=157864 RepID=A0ABD2ISW3_9BILA